MKFLEKFFKTKHKVEHSADKPIKESFKPEQSKEVDDGNDFKEVSEEPELEDKEQFMEKRFNISTVYDFIQALKWSYDEAGNESEDADIKQKLAHQIIKITAGLNTASLHANEVVITKMESGVLGTYNPKLGKVSASSDMLEDFNSDERLFKTVFLHEKTHQDGIADEGLTQLRVERKISATPGIYEDEKEKAKRTFYKEGVDQALVLYSVKNPEKLVDYYLEVELKNKYSMQEIKKLTANKEIEKEAKKTGKEYSSKIKTTIPRLHERLSSGYFNKKVKKILENLGSK